MRLKYQTAVATLVQFIVLGLFNIANGIDSVVAGCRNDESDCMSNLFTSAIFYLLITAWFGLIAGLGYVTQERRSKRLAQLLIAAEALTILVAALNIKLNLHKYADSLLSLSTSFTDILLALWVISLAYRLMRAGGGRITAQRPRRR